MKCQNTEIYSHNTEIYTELYIKIYTTKGYNEDCKNDEK